MPSEATIIGLGVYRPALSVSNEELSNFIQSESGWIESRSGIRSRRWADHRESLLEMARAASEGAIRSSGLCANDIDLIIVSTISHMYQTPSLAAELASSLRTDGCPAFDISAACAGFCYALQLARDAIRSGSAHNVLVVGAERISDITDFSDRSIMFLHGDGAGAVVVGRSAISGISQAIWGSDGSKVSLLGQDVSWHAFSENPCKTRKPALRMKGQEVFRWASFSLVTYAQRALERANVSATQIQAFIPHQANKRIIENIANKLQLPEDVVIAQDIVTQGNTSSASIPLAMHALLREGELQGGETALLVGFGAGMTYASQVVKVPLNFT